MYDLHYNINQVLLSPYKHIKQTDPDNLIFKLLFT